VRDAGGKLALLSVLVLTTGCYAPITDLKEYLPEEQVAEFPTVDSVLTYYFTPEAHEAVKDIPAIDGFLTITAYAAGVNGWSNTLSFLSGTGIGRKVIYSQTTLMAEGYPGLIHEYVHHLDDLTRDDPENHQWINLDVFLQAYQMLLNDHTYKGIQRWCDERANDWIPNTFGVGHAAEHVAYIAMFLTSRDEKTGKPRKAPDYLKAVFSRVLSLSYNKKSGYTNLKEERFLVTASPDKIELVRAIR